MITCAERFTKERLTDSLFITPYTEGSSRPRKNEFEILLWILVLG